MSAKHEKTGTARYRCPGAFLTAIQAVLIVLAAEWLLARPAFAQSIEATDTHVAAILGTVADANGDPIPNATIVLQGLAGDRMVRLHGILNGTCNFILTRMERDGAPFLNALEEAQRLGFAEAEPTDDGDARKISTREAKAYANPAAP